MNTSDLDRDRLAVTGLELVSSLGHTLATSCAAARAGLTRTTPMMGMRFADPDDDEETPLAAHLVWGLGEGYSGLGRLVRLGTLAVQALMRATELADCSDSALLLVLNDDWHIVQATKMLVEAGTIDEETAAETVAQLKFRQQVIRQETIGRIMSCAGIVSTSAHRRALHGDQSTFVRALKEAHQLLYQGGLRRVVLGALDSQLSEETLQAYRSLGLLKSPANAAGFRPGEMAGFVVLEKVDSDHKRNPVLIVHGLATVAGSSGRFSDAASPDGQALADCVDQSLQSPHEGKRPCGLVIGDLTGDGYCARDWGAAMVRLRRRHPEIAEAPQWYPAAHFGNIGVAGGLAAIGLAAQAFARLYSPSPEILAWLASDSGSRGAFRISQGPH